MESPESKIQAAPSSVQYEEYGWPNDRNIWHAHDDYELHLIVETHGTVFVGDYVGDFAPGSLILTGPNLPHDWVTNDTYPGPIKTRDLVLHFSQGSIDKLTLAFPEFRDIRLLLLKAVSGLEFVNFDTDSAKEFLRNIRDSTGANRILHLIQFLIQLNHHPDQKLLSVAKLATFEARRKHNKITEVIEYVTQNYTETLSVERAAEMATMTQTTFRRNFRATTGHCFVDFVNRIRISQACELLYSTDDQVTTICYQVGYQNLANFNRQFRKLKGSTPSEYREVTRRDCAKVAS